MPAFLAPLLAGWRPYVAAAALAAVVAAGAYVYALRADVARLAAEKATLAAGQATALRAAAANAREVEALTVSHEATLRGVRSFYERRLESAEDVSARTGKVLNAPLSSDDGPIAPVLRNVLDELRRRAAAASSNRGEGGAGAHTGAVPELR